LREALQRARRLHGEDAVVVGQELAANGGVTLTVARKASATTPAVLGSRGETRSEPKNIALTEVAGRLRKNGASPAFVERVLDAVMARKTEGAHVLDTAALVIGEMFQTARLPRARGQARILALAGAGGVGKTTTTAKIAMRLVRAGRRVELVTFDAERPGAVEQLRAWSTLLNAPFRVARTGADLDVKSIATADLIVVDTCGRPERDIARLERLRANCAEIGAELEVYLVLSAGASASMLRAITSTLGILSPSAVVVTKLDETNEPIAVLEHVLEAGLPIAFLSDGPDVHAHLQRADAEHIADLCLRGKLS
jgi:flagellar biosynthesis protein FlhF